MDYGLKFLLLWTCFSVIGAPSCTEQDYTKCFSGICYTVVLGSHCKKTQPEAKTRCNQKYPGKNGRLAMIKTAAIENALKTESGWSGGAQEKYGEEESFIGLEQQSGTTFRWIDGEATGYTNWKDNEPNTGKACATMKYEDSASDIKWKSKQCDHDKYYVCQYTEECPVGYSGNSCTPCGVGTYKDTTGSASCTSCEATKTTTGTGSDNVNDCICIAGYEGGSCTECQVGFYKPTIGSSSCSMCGSGKTTTSTASDSQEDCVCSPGHTGDSCSTCALGSYKTGTGYGACTPCEEGKTTENQGADMASLCVCSAGYTGSSCDPCSIGTYKIDTGSGACTSCGEGKTTQNEGASVVSLCICKAGYEGGSCTACQVGFYKSTTGSGSCLACGLGKTTTSPGADDPGDCVCIAGYEGGICTACQVGFYKSTTGSGSCSMCGSGKTTTSTASDSEEDCVCSAGHGGESCYPCEIGKYKIGPGSGNCVSCGASKTTENTGATDITMCVCREGHTGAICGPCGIGTYKNSTGPGDCDSCEGGKTTENPGATTISSCVCSRGHTGPSCSACPIGWYKTGTGSEDCTPCETGKTTENTGANNALLCVCAVGHEGSGCSECQLGFYKSVTGSSPCSSCGPGKTTSETGTDDSEDCICKAGYGGSSCIICPTGSYKPGTGSGNCTLCTVGFTTLSPGATVSTLCVSSSAPTCTVSVQVIRNNHYVMPSFATVAAPQTLTLECQSGWTYNDTDTNKTFGCTAMDTWSPTLMPCEVNTECAAIPEAERVDCGWDGISRLECEANMCCYSSTGSVPCYFKESRSNAVIESDNNTCTFHGKKYSFVSTSGPIAEPCPNEYRTLAVLKYDSEFYLLRMCLSLLESDGMAAEDRWIDGNTTSSNHISDLADYYPQPGSGDNCVSMSTRRDDGTDEAKPVNLFRKDCSEAAFPICFKHLDEMSLLVSQPNNSGQCTAFSPGTYSEVLLWQTYIISDPTSKGYSLHYYRLERSIQCDDFSVLFSTTKGDDVNCKRTRPCRDLQKLPNTLECYRMCPCDGTHCQSTVFVGPMTNQNQWSLCPLSLA